MKRIVIATAALALSGGAAMADFSVSGSGAIGLSYEDSGTGTTVGTFADFDITFSASGTTDGGLSFGAKSKIDANNAAVNAGTDTEVWVSGDWGKLTMGNSLDDAIAGGVAGVGLDIGGGDAAEWTDMAETKADVRYDGTFGTVSVALSGKLTSGTMGEGDWGMSMGYDMAPVSFSVGFNSNDVISAGVGYAFGEISGNLSYVGQSAGGDEMHKANAIGADATFQAGDMSVTVVYSRCSGTDDSATKGVTENNGCGTESDAGIGVSMDLGGGATLKAGLTSEKVSDSMKKTKADFGIAMAF